MEQNTLNASKDKEGGEGSQKNSQRNSQRNSQTDSVKLNSDHSTTVTDTSKINNATNEPLKKSTENINQPLNEKMDENEEPENSI